jgi:hypothetical protein
MGPIYPPVVPAYLEINIMNYSGSKLISIKYVSTKGTIIEKKTFGAKPGYMISEFTGDDDTSSDPYGFYTRELMFGFSDGKGGTIYSQKFDYQYRNNTNNCPGLPCKVAGTTISFKPADYWRPYSFPAEYVLKN